MDLAEFANRLSEILTGCREAPEEEMLREVRHLKDLERSLICQKRLIKLKELIDKFQEDLEEFVNCYEDEDE